MKKKLNLNKETVVMMNERHMGLIMGAGIISLDGCGEGPTNGCVYSDDCTWPGPACGDTGDHCYSRNAECGGSPDTDNCGSPGDGDGGNGNG